MNIQESTANTRPSTTGADHQTGAEPVLLELFDGLTLPTLLRIAALGDGTDPDPAPSAVEPRQMTELAL